MFNRIAKKVATVVSAGLVTIGSAHAALDTVTAGALGDMKTDALAAGALVLAAVIGIFTLKFIRKAL